MNTDNKIQALSNAIRIIEDGLGSVGFDSVKENTLKQLESMLNELRDERKQLNERS